MIQIPHTMIRRIISNDPFGFGSDYSKFQTKGFSEINENKDE